MVVKDKGFLKPNLYRGLWTQVLYLRGVSAVAETKSTVRGWSERDLRSARI
jgi:hypothetical protein